MHGPDGLEERTEYYREAFELDGQEADLLEELADDWLDDPEHWRDEE